MSDVLYFNGRFTTTDEPVISVEDRGFQFGDAVYEVFKFQRRAPVFMREHYTRLLRSLGMVAIPVPLSFEELASIAAELLRKTTFSEGILYLQVSRGACKRAHVYPELLTPTVVMYSRSFTFPDLVKRERGIHLATMPDERWERCDIKSTNLLPNALAKKRAHLAAADEALLLRGKEVREGASSNFFAVIGDRVITHPSDGHVLDGVVRDQVIALALARRIRVDERPLREDELLTMDEAFVTSTTQGVMPVTTLNGRSVRNGRRGPTTEILQNAFSLLEERSATLG